MKKEFLKIGKIVGTHGVRGMVRIEPWADSGDFLKNFKHFYTDDGNAIELTGITPHGNIVLAKITGVDSIEAAERFRHTELSVKRDEINLPPDKYFIEEITGAAVYNKNGVLLGTLTDVFKTGANDVWQVTKDGKNYLLPVIDDLEISVDTEKDVITLNPLKGIFDDEN